MADGKCNVGFIGCGELMTGQHIQNAHRSKICRVHTLCDIDKARLEKIAAKYPPQKKATDYKTMLADPEVQLVVIAMNPEKHAAIALDALHAGKDVYVEKPMGVSLAEARELAQTAKKLGRRLTTGFNRRFAPAYLDLSKYLRPREGGLTIFYRIADRERWERHDSSRLLHELVHVFDIIPFFTGSEPTVVYANEGWHKNDNIITLTFADKSIATILSTGRTDSIPKERVELHWEQGAIEVESFVEARYYNIKDAPLVKRYPGRVSDTAGNLQGLGDENGLEKLREILRESSQHYHAALAGKMTKEDVVAKSRGYLEEKGWAQALDEMALSILENRTPANATPSDGIRSIVVSEAAFESLRTGQAVKLDPKLWRI
jgi:predicted dehydrogenase